MDTRHVWSREKAVDFCAVRRYYAKVQEKLETQFFSISLKEILEQEGA